LTDKIVNSRGRVKGDPRRALPAVDRIVRALEDADPALPTWALREAAREVLDAERARLGGDTPEPAAAASDGELVARARARAVDLARPHPQPVINATGILLHTNLGRAPLAPGAAHAIEVAARSYGDLELELEGGVRGARGAAVEHKLRLLSGAGGALVVNNNAAAVLLVLAGLAHGRSAIVSRGELVEIGGSFRVPDIMESAGVRLVEVGTTNRTHLRDYASAIDADTALLLKVHRSNFALRGFVAEVELGELAALADERGLPLAEDLGSGTLIDLSSRGFPEEVFAPGRLARGAGVVCFSADKLLGGPQAGIVLTRDAALADRLRRHPLARALRVDKLSLAALDWVLSAHLEGRAEAEIPVLRQLLALPDALRRRATALAERLSASAGFRAKAHVEADRSFAGGGSLPEHALESWVVRVEAPIGAERLAALLRTGRPPVVARVHDDRLVLDVRTLLDGDEDGLVRALLEALR
jgi:L-seryl-tRNA(Ser) seleniumtransferase